MVSCGSYKRNTTETDVQEDIVEQQSTANNKVITETLERTIDYYGDDKLAPVGTITPRRANPKWTFREKKATKTTDKGKSETTTDASSSLKTKDKNKQNPWQPPWWLSGLIVLVLLVMYKVFKTKYQIIKKTKIIQDEKI
jgi:hypothetical protein